MADETLLQDTIALAREAVKQDNLLSVERYFSDLIKNIDYVNVDMSTKTIKALNDLANKSHIIAKRRRYDKMANICGTLTSATLYHKTIFTAKNALEKAPSSQFQWMSNEQLVAVREIREVLEVAEKQLDRIYLSLASSIEREVLDESKWYHNWKLSLGEMKKVIRTEWLITLSDYLRCATRVSESDSYDSGIQFSPRTSNSYERKSDSVFNSTSNSDKDIDGQKAEMVSENCGQQTLPVRSSVLPDQRSLYRSGETKLCVSLRKQSSFNHVDIKTDRQYISHNYLNSNSTLPSKKLQRSWSTLSSTRPKLRGNISEDIYSSCIDISSQKNTACNGFESHKTNTNLSLLALHRKSIDLDKLHDNIQLLVRKISADTRRSSIRERPSEDLLRTSIEAGLNNWYYLREDHKASGRAERLSWIERLASDQIDLLDNKSSLDEDIFIPPKSNITQAMFSKERHNILKDKNTNNSEVSNEVLKKQCWQAMVNSSLQKSSKKKVKVIRVYNSTYQNLKNSQGECIRTTKFKRFVYRDRLKFEPLSPVATVFSKVTRCISTSFANVDTISSISSLLLLQTDDNINIWSEYINVLLRVTNNLRTSPGNVQGILNLHSAMLDILLNTTDSIIHHLSIIGDVVKDASLALFSTGEFSRGMQILEDALYIYMYSGQQAVFKLAKTWLLIGQMYANVKNVGFTSIFNKIARLVRKTIIRWSAKPRRSSGSRSIANEERTLATSSLDLFSANKIIDSGCEYGGDSDETNYSDDDSDEEDGGDYDVGLHEAMSAFLHAEATLKNEYEANIELKATFLLAQGALADCRMMMGDHFVAMEQYEYVINNIDNCSQSKELFQLHIHCLLMSAVDCFLKHQLSKCLILLEKTELLHQTVTAHEKDEVLFSCLLSANAYHNLEQVSIK